MDESFITLEDIEQCEIEDIVSMPNTDSISVCLCRGVCLRESGRNACPCIRVVGSFFLGMPRKKPGNAFKRVRQIRQL